MLILMGVKDLEFKVQKEWITFRRENSWAVHIPEVAEDTDGDKFMRRMGSERIYKVVGKNEGENYNYVCNDCGSDIMSARVAHPIHDGPFPGSGSGRCHYESVPYCPKCEDEPSFSGAPISIGCSY
jgi:hypothetical protein